MLMEPTVNALDSKHAVETSFFNPKDWGLKSLGFETRYQTSLPFRSDQSKAKRESRVKIHRNRGIRPIKDLLLLSTGHRCIIFFMLNWYIADRMFQNGM